ncbi:MAG: hypothetical protein RLZZ224_1739 [Verrucomicrobiota bacterium]
MIGPPLSTCDKQEINTPSKNVNAFFRFFHFFLQAPQTPFPKAPQRPWWSHAQEIIATDSRCCADQKSLLGPVAWKATPRSCPPFPCLREGKRTLFLASRHKIATTPPATTATVTNGEVAEWSIASVLKTEDGKPSVGSNPTLSAILRFLQKLRMACHESRCKNRRMPFVARRAK